MAEWTAYIGNYPCSKGKEWRPGGRRDPCHQDITLSHVFELIGAVNDPRRGSDTPRAGRDSFQHITRGLAGTSWHHTAEVDSQKAGSTFDRQGHWRRESAFALPGCVPLGDDRMIVCWWLSWLPGVQCGCGLLQFVQCQPEHVGGLDHA